LRNIFITLLVAAPALPISAQNSLHSESRHFPFECLEVAERAEAYLSERGISTFEKNSFHSISIVGREHEPLSAGSLSKGRKLKPWMDAQGGEITDFKVYWDYVNRETGDKLPLGIWRIRSAHYQPQGEIELKTDNGGCSMVFRLIFKTWGANVIAILPVDSSWGYGSNGQMERGYMDGIQAALEKRKPAASQSHP
jgi:hypothetical protein